MKLLEKLASSPSRVFSPNEILDDVWRDHIRRSLPALSGLLRRLRQKMAKNGFPDPVENVRGRGVQAARIYSAQCQGSYQINILQPHEVILATASPSLSVSHL
jgi:DNA-binding winged helix-turn-helix (wHTH) protein